MFKKLFCWAFIFSSGAYFRRGLLLEGILRFKIGWLKQLALTVHVLMFGTGRIIGRIFASEIWGAYFREGVFIYLFLGGGGAGGRLLSEF